MRNASRSFIPILIAAATALIAGCAGTQAAYRAADTPAETAFVLKEHYAAVLKEAVALKAKPTTPAELVAALQKADKAAQPAIDALEPLAKTYTDVRSAKSEADLQAAIDKAVLLLADLVRAVKSARGSPTGSLAPPLELRPALAG